MKLNYSIFRLVTYVAIALPIAIGSLFCTLGHASQSLIDRNALIQIDKDMDGNNALNWNELPRNTNPGDGGSWAGVDWTRSSPERVSVIYASQIGLTGASTGWSALTSLKRLDLSYNQITDAGVVSLSTLTGLKILCLSGNQITSVDNLGTLTALQSLFLTYNHISRVDSLGTLTGLQILDLLGNKITSVESLGTLTALTYLNLSINQISSVDGLGTLTSLTDLNLSGNQITSVDGLGSLTALTHLDLSGIQITDAGAVSLGTLTGLQVLNLSSNQLSRVDSLGTLTALEVLDLSGNQISSVDSLGTLTALTYLNLSGNRLTRADMFPTGIYRSGSSLNVDGNALPLSQLYPHMGISNLSLGQQHNVTFSAFTGDMSPGIPYDLSSESAFGGKATVFRITLANGDVATSGVHYVESNGVITFLIPGNYIVSMTNEAIYSKGDLGGEDFETISNNYGEVQPLVVVNTGTLSVFDR